MAARAGPTMVLAETSSEGAGMGRYAHLSIAEREEIMVRWRDHEGVSQIAREVGRDKSTISRELRRNGWVSPVAGLCYRASTAQGRADARRARCRRPRLMDDPERRSLVASLIRDRRWSPEQAAARIAMERPSLSVSDATIYRAVADGTLDREMPGGRRISTRLRRRGRRRRGASETRGRIRVTHEIAERPAVVDRRCRVGDWEGDTVVGKMGGACLVTQVDRRSGYLAGGKAPKKAHAEVNAVIERALAGQPVRTVTLDRGKEFSDAASLQRSLGAPVYFCLPHHPWQRGTNENTNGLLRDFFPKGRSLDDVTDEEVREAYDMLNRRPRKRLGWKCPWEVYHHKALHLL